MTWPSVGHVVKPQHRDTMCPWKMIVYVYHDFWKVFQNCRTLTQIIYMQMKLWYSWRPCSSILIINANGQSQNFLARVVCTSGLIFDLLLPNVCLVECMYKRRIWQDIVIKKLGQIPTSSRLNMRLPNSEHDSFSGCKILLCCCLYHNAKSTKLNQCCQLC